MEQGQRGPIGSPSEWPTSPLAFGHLDTVEDRLRTLTALGVLDRFRPRRDTGSAPYHYVLGPLGAATLAAEQQITVAELGYRRGTALAIAHYQRLPEIVAVNGFFTTLTAYARHHPDTELARWLSQRQCHAIWGTLVQPHGFGRWRDHDTTLEFFLEHRHEERFSDLIAALAGYDTLAQATPQLATNLLVVLTSPQRETELHRTVPPRQYLLATATPQPGSNPAEAIWLPLGSTGPRQRLADLPHLHHQHRISHNPGPAVPQAACWNTDGPSRLPVEDGQQRRVTVLLPEDPPLVTGPVAAVLLRILVEAGKSPGRPGITGVEATVRIEVGH